MPIPVLAHFTALFFDLTLPLIVVSNHTAYMYVSLFLYVYKEFSASVRSLFQRICTECGFPVCESSTFRSQRPTTDLIAIHKKCLVEWADTNTDECLSVSFVGL